MGQHVREYVDVVPNHSANHTGVEVAVRNSAVVVDADRAVARALLFDLVDGTPRFIGVGTCCSTTLPPYENPSLGIAQAIQELEAQTGRHLLENDRLVMPQQANGDGVDAGYVTGVPVAPTHAALITVGRSPLSALLASAARRTMAVLFDAAEDLGSANGTFSSAAVQSWLRSVHPSIVILVFENGTAEDWTVVLDAIADAAQEDSIKQGIVVADETHQQSAAATLGSLFDLSGIDPAEYDAREIAAALETELRDSYARAVSSAPSAPALSSATFVDRIQASRAVTAFLHRRIGRNVAAVAGGEGTLLQLATQGGGATVLRADLDLQLGVRSLLRISVERVMRWLPFRSSAEEITQWVLNRALRPFTEPDGRSDLLLAAAFEREILSSLMAAANLPDAADVDLVAAGPTFAGGDRPLALLTILDGLMPNPHDGVTSIALDGEGLLVAIGALATDDPAYARDILEQDFLTPWASCIVVNGSAADGALAVRGELRPEGGEPRRFSVPFGNLQVLPLAEGHSAALTLEPEPGFSIGSRPAGEPVTFDGDHPIFGGEFGAIIDARGRPIALPPDPELRVARLKSWIVDLGGRID